MLEQFKEGLEYKRMSQDEMAARGILGRLVGKCADILRPTRNGRKYTDKLWEKCFSDPIVKEQYAAGGIFGELTHPDREEVDMEKIAVIMPEPPKKGDDGYLYGEWHILDTPCGRILKTLCDYGYKVGISTRGSGEVEENYDGTEDVIPDSYSLSALDIVLVPAVKEARLDYMTESLDKKKYNKTLRTKLQESLNKASDSDKKIMKEALDDIGLYLDEPRFRSPKYHDGDVVFVGDANGYQGSFLIKGDIEKLPQELYPNIRRVMKYGNTDEPFYKVEYKLPEGSHLFEEDYMKFFEYVEDLLAANDIEVVEATGLAESKSLNEDDLHDVFRKDAKDQYKRYSKKMDAWNKKADEYKELGIDPELSKNLAGQKPKEFKLDKGYNKLERQNYPFYVTFYEGTSYYHPEEGGYYVAGLEPYYSEGFNSFEEAQEELLKYLEENTSTKVSFKPNLPIDDDNYAYSEDEEEYQPYYDAKDRLIGAVARGKYIGEEEQVWIESNKQYLKKQSGDSMYESLSEDWSHDKYDELMEKGKDNWDQDDWEAYHYIMQAWSELDVDESLNEDADDKLIAIMDKINSRVVKNMEDAPLGESNKTKNTAVDNNEAIANELQEMLKKNIELESKVAKLQEQLSVCYTKDEKHKEEIQMYEAKIRKLANSRKEQLAISEQLKEAQDKVNLLTEQKEEAERKANTLGKLMERSSDVRTSLKESLSSSTEENVSLKEQNKKLEESIDSLSKDKEVLKKQLTEKLQKSNQLVEKYKSIANKAVDKYINSQANILGVKPDEIKNRLPESYSFKDIDAACEEVKQYRLSMDKLPFITALKESKENVRLSAKSSKKDSLVIGTGLDDEVDNQLLQLAGIQ